MRAPALSLAFFAAIGCSGATESQSEAIPEEPDYTPTAERVALTRPPTAMNLEEIDMNARRGRILFVTKGCVMCHAANNVGGRAAPPLDAPENGAREINPLVFSVRMWEGAPAMVSLQRIELGYQIDLDAQDIADLAAFAASADEQKLLTVDSLPEGFENWFINDRFWDNDQWLDYMSRGERIPDASEFDKQ